MRTGYPGNTGMYESIIKPKMQLGQGNDVKNSANDVVGNDNSEVSDDYLTAGLVTDEVLHSDTDTVFVGDYGDSDTSKYLQILIGHKESPLSVGHKTDTGDTGAGKVPLIIPASQAAINFLNGAKIFIGGAISLQQRDDIRSKNGTANETGRKSDLIKPINNIDELKESLQKLMPVSQLATDLNEMINEDPSITDRIVFVDDPNAGATYRSGDSVLERDLPASEITLGKGTSIFVVIHELAHFLPLKKIRRYLPQEFEYPEVDTNADIITVAKNILLQQFADEAAAAIFEVQLAHDLLVAGVHPAEMPSYVFEEKELFDLAYSKFIESYVYLGDNHKILYPIAGAIRVAHIIKENPKKLKDIKISDIGAADIGNMSVKEIADFIRRHQGEITKIEEFITEFLDGDYKKYFGDVGKFQSAPDELKDAVIVAGGAIKKLEMYFSKTAELHKHINLISDSIPLILKFNGKRFSRIIKALLESTVNAGKQDAEKISNLVVSLLIKKGYEAAAKKTAPIGRPKIFISSPAEFKRLTGVEHPFKKLMELGGEMWRVRSEEELEDKGGIIDLDESTAKVLTKVFISREIIEKALREVSLSIDVSKNLAFRFRKEDISDALVYNGLTGLTNALKYLIKTVGLESITEEEKALFRKAFEFMVGYDHEEYGGDKSVITGPFNTLLEKDEKNFYDTMSTFAKGLSSKLNTNYSQYYTFLLDVYLSSLGKSAHGKKEVTEFLDQVVTSFVDVTAGNEIIRHEGWANAFMDLILKYYEDEDSNVIARIGASAFKIFIYAEAGLIEEATTMLSHLMKKDLLKDYGDDLTYIIKYLSKKGGDKKVLEQYLHQVPKSAVTGKEKSSETAGTGDEAPSNKRVKIAMPDAVNSSIENIEGFLSAVDESVRSGQPVISSAKDFMTWIGSLNKRREGDEYVAEAAQILLSYIEHGYGGDLKQWIGMLDRLNLAHELKDILLEDAVELMIPEEAGIKTLSMVADVAQSALTLGPAVLRAEYPAARRLFLKRLAGYVNNTRWEIGNMPDAYITKFVKNIIYPLVNVHPELLSEQFYDNFRAIPHDDSSLYISPLNTMFLDSNLLDSVDTSKDITEWNPKLIAFGSMDADAAEAKIVEEISANKDNDNYPAERAKKLEEIISMLLRFRLNEYIAFVGFDESNFKESYSAADLQEIPFLNFLFYAIDEKDVLEWQSGDKASMRFTGAVPPNLWDYIEEQMPLTPVQEAVFKAVLDARSTTEARAKAEIYRELLGFDGLGYEFRKLAVEGLMLTGIASPYIKDYYDSIKDNPQRLSEFIGYLFKFIEMNGYETIPSYAFATLNLFHNWGKENIFWQKYGTFKMKGYLALNDAYGVYFVFPALLSDSYANISEGNFVYELLRDYFDAVARNAPANEVERKKSHLDSLNYRSSPVKFYFDFNGPEDAKRLMQSLNNAKVHEVGVKMALKEIGVALPATIKKMPDFVRYFFTEYLLCLTPLNRKRLYSIMEEKVKDKDDVEAVKSFLETVKLEKLGQIIHMLYGIVPDEWRDRFKSMLEENQAAGFYEIKRVIENEFGEPLGQIFSFFDEQPSAVGSIAQVHMAKLKNGREVAVKVISPSRKKMVEDALTTLEIAVKRYDSDKAAFSYVPVDIAGFYGWFKASMEPEFDLTREAKNAALFKKKAGKEISIPKIYKVTKSVMIMQRVDIPKERITKDDAHAVIKAVLTAMLGGVVYDDPHPGNIAGRVLFDFGRMEKLTSGEIDDLGGFMIAVYTAHEAVGSVADVENAIKRLSTGDSQKKESSALSEYLTSGEFRNSPLNGELLRNIIRHAGEDGFVLRPKMYAVMKVLLMLDEMGRRFIGEDFSMAALATGSLSQPESSL